MSGLNLLAIYKLQQLNGDYNSDKSIDFDMLDDEFNPYNQSYSNAISNLIDDGILSNISSHIEIQQYDKEAFNQLTKIILKENNIEESVFMGSDLTDLAILTIPIKENACTVILEELKKIFDNEIYIESDNEYSINTIYYEHGDLYGCIYICIDICEVVYAITDLKFIESLYKYKKEGLLLC